MASIKFIGHYAGGTEYCNVEIDGSNRYLLEKVDSCHPHWRISLMTGRRLGIVKTLEIMRDAIESGAMEERIASYRGMR